MEFVQLSRGIQIAAGESVFLRCLANKPVVQCEWSWRSTNSSTDANVVKKFHPNADAEHDCSVRFKNVLHEEEGLWTCGVKLTNDGFLHEAPPATVTLLPSGKSTIRYFLNCYLISRKHFSFVFIFIRSFFYFLISFICISIAKVNFVETPEDTVVQIGTDATLKCATNGRVEKCAWLQRSLSGNAEDTIVKEFPSSGDLGKDCSLNLPRVTMEEQGFWSCQVSISSLNNVLTTSPAKLTVYEKGRDQYFWNRVHELFTIFLIFYEEDKIY